MDARPDAAREPRVGLLPAMRRAWIAALVLAAGAACAGLLPWSEDPRLVAWKTQASALRGLAFEQPVELEWISTAQIPDVIRGELGGVLTPERARRYRDAYAALGVFPPDLDYVETMLRLQTDALAGIYSPRRKTLYVLDTLSDAEPGANPGQSVIVVHELVHALQHQHFPETIDLLVSLRRQDDVLGAVSAVLEGDATFTMLAVGAQPGAPDARTERMAERVRDSMLAEAARPDGPMAGAPRLLRESLIFSYAWGTPLAARRFAAAGNAGLDEALRDPPLSTLRVLVPSDTDPVEFVRLPEAELASRVAARGCTLGDDNVAGALTLRVLFEEYARDASTDIDALVRGWRGDRFVQIECAKTWELVWLTRWDSAEAAERFASAYRAIAPAIAARSPLAGVPEVVVRDRTSLVVTPGLREAAAWLIGASEIRGYGTFVEWRQDGCFPESPCPVSGGN